MKDTYTINNIDSEIKALQHEFTSLIISSSFDKNEFEKQLNPKMHEYMIELLNTSLNTGDNTSLEYCAERIHAGLLNNHPIFKTSLSIDQRDKFIYDISVHILKCSIENSLPNQASIAALKNILIFCPSEAKTIGLFEKKEFIFSIYHYLKNTGI